MQDRRSFLRFGMRAGVLAGLPPVVWSSDRLPDEGLAVACADAARRIDRQGSLNLLMPQGSESNLAPIVQAFTSMTGVQINTKIAPVDDINTHILLARRGSSAEFDVALPATYGIADLARAQAIMPLDAYVEKYEPTLLSAQMVYRTGSDYLDRFYGYQADGDVYLMFLNSALIAQPEIRKRIEDQLGNVEQLTHSWQSLDRLMAVVHQPEKNVFGGSLFRSEGYLLWEFWLRMHEKGLLPLSPSAEPQIDHPPAVAALTELVNATRSLHADTAGNSLFQNWHSFAQGNKALNIGWGGSQKSFQRAPNDFAGGLTTFAPPGQTNGKQGMPYFNWGWNYTVRQGSERAELAYLFTLFATSEDMSKAAVRAADGYFDPYQYAHYSDAEIVSVYSEPFLAVHRDAMTRCIPDFYVIGQGRYFASLSRYLTYALHSKLTPADALTYAAREWRKLHAEIGWEQQQQVWQNLMMKYPDMQLG